jgi:hypothetical protein
MMTEKRSALFEQAENMGWKVTECSDGSVEFEKHSPAGEDFIFAVNGENIAAEVRNYFADFDADEHAEMWVMLKHEQGMESRGIPDIRTLVDDAVDIDKMLCELATALDEVEV